MLNLILIYKRQWKPTIITTITAIASTILEGRQDV